MSREPWYEEEKYLKSFSLRKRTGILEYRVLQLCSIHAMRRRWVRFTNPKPCVVLNCEGVTGEVYLI